MLIRGPIYFEVDLSACHLPIYPSIHQCILSPHQTDKTQRRAITVYMEFSYTNCIICLFIVQKCVRNVMAASYYIPPPH